MPLFEIAIIQQPTAKEEEEGTGQEKLLYGPVPILAKDGPTASLIALRSDKVPADIDLNRAEVIVRPFA